MRAVLRNVCLMRIRENRGEVLVGELPRGIEGRLAKPSVEESIDRLALRDWVWTALGRLPEVLQTTAVLRYFGSHASYATLPSLNGTCICWDHSTGHTFPNAT